MVRIARELHVWTRMASFVATAVVLWSPSAAGAHNAVPPPGTDPAVRATYAYRSGVYPAGYRRPLVYYQDSPDASFPGANGRPSSWKTAIWRGAAAWNAVGRDFVFRNNRFYETRSVRPFIWASRRADHAYYTQVPAEREDVYQAWCDETRDDPTTPQVDRVPLNLIYWADPAPDADGVTPLGEAIRCHQGRGTGAPYKFAVALSRGGEDDWWRWPGRRHGDDRIYDRIDLQGIATHEFGHATGFSGHFPEGPATPDRPADCSSSMARHTMCEGHDVNGLLSVSLRYLAPHDRETFSNAYPPR